MQKKNNKGVIALIIVLVLVAAALVIWQTNKRETQQGGKEITVNVDHLNGDDTTFTIHTDEEYLRGALEQEDLIEGTESEYGLYVLTVDGETADESEQQWWGYSVNGDDTTFTIHTDEEYLRGALEQEDLIEGTESEYGLYVLTVDGETADESEQQWWGYSVNGTFAELGVDSQPVADGDVYDFVLNVGW